MAKSWFTTADQNIISQNPELRKHMKNMARASLGNETIVAVIKSRIAIIELTARDKFLEEEYKVLKETYSYEMIYKMFMAYLEIRRLITKHPDLFKENIQTLVLNSVANSPRMLEKMIKTIEWQNIWKAA